MADVSGQIIKGYELQERIGAGGFGAVYRAYQSTVGREVAIKIILPGYANQPEFIRRFESEAQTIARLEHMHIVPLYDYWREPDGAYLIMRWMRGGSMRDILKQNGAYSLEKIAQILDQLASALALAHRNQVIHRDLKPGNILLDEEGNAYLADFGIAKDTTEQHDGSHTEPDMIIGSPDYLSPEQARSEPVTPQTDIYSLGVVLYEMLVGEHPFPQLTPIERLYKHLSDPLPLVTTLEADVSHAINEVIQKATAKNPTRRYADTLALSAAFREAAALNQTPTEGTVVEMLTRREQEILHSITEGRTNKEIADQLFVTVATVKWYITQIYRKLQVRSRMQAIVRARELNLVVKSNTVVDDLTVQGVLDGATLIPTNQFQPDNPYKGLRAFETSDYRDFFGRERLVQRLVKHLAEDGILGRFLAVVGPSGSGKSSLVKAGLIPALWRGVVPNSEKWFIVEMMPGTRPLDELEIALTRIATTKVSNLHEQLQRDSHGLVRATKLVLPDDETELVLVIDQFEEVFTLVEDEAERAHFLDLLYRAVNERRSRVRIIITLRADFYDRPLHYPEFGELMHNRMETILPLGAKELERVIRSPAEQVGVKFEEGLVETMVDEVHYQAGALPLLQYALTELFEQRQGRQLTLETYHEIGRVTGALAKQAENLYREADAERREVIRQLFLRLVTLGDGVDDTRRRTHRIELLAVTSQPDLMDDVIDTFAEYRLLSLDHNPTNRRPTVEVAHEALLHEWARLANWLDESRQDILQQRQLAQLTTDWLENDKDVSFLLRGNRLVQFETFHNNTELALTQNEKQYIQASLTAHQQALAAEEARQVKEFRLEKRAQNFLRGLVAVLFLATLAGFGLSAVALQQRDIAEDNESRAERNAEISQSLALASAAQAALSEGNTDQALALAYAANQIGNAPAFSQRILFEAASAPGTQAQIVGGAGWRWAIDVSPDGLLVVSGGDDSVVNVWNLATGEEVLRLTDVHHEGIANTLFTPDGKGLLITSWDDQIILWDIATQEPIWETVNPNGDPNGSVISADGTFLLVASERDAMVNLFDMQTGELVGQLTGHNPAAQVQGVAFDPTGTFAATSSEEGTIIIWDVAKREIVHELDAHAREIIGLDFSPDGTQLASASFDNLIKTWNIETGTLIQEFSGHTDFVFAVQWNSLGTQIVTASRDSTLRLWDVNSGELVHTYSGETGRLLNVVFLDDQHVLTGSSFGMLRRWSLFDERENQALYYPPTFSLAQYDNQMVIGSENALILVDKTTQNELARFEYSGGAVTSAVFSPDGAIMYGGFADSQIVAWDIASGEEIRQFDGHEIIQINKVIQFGDIQDLAVSPDGQFLLSAGQDKRLILWDAASGAIIAEFTSESDTINAVAFSPDRQYFAAGYGSLVFPLQGLTPERDYTIHVWETNSRREIRQLVGHEGAITTIQFSPDSEYIISGAIDETLRLWNVKTGQEVRQFIGHSGGILSVEFNPDGKFIVSGAQDGNVIIWNVETNDLVRQFSEHTALMVNAQFDDIGWIWSVSQDGTIHHWNPFLDLAELQTWTNTNRLVRDLTCSEQELYLFKDCTKS